MLGSVGVVPDARVSAFWANPIDGAPQGTHRQTPIPVNKNIALSRARMRACVRLRTCSCVVWQTRTAACRAEPEENTTISSVAKPKATGPTGAGRSSASCRARVKPAFRQTPVITFWAIMDDHENPIGQTSDRGNTRLASTMERQAGTNRRREARSNKSVERISRTLNGGLPINGTRHDGSDN